MVTKNKYFVFFEKTKYTKYTKLTKNIYINKQLKDKGLI